MTDVEVFRGKVLWFKSTYGFICPEGSKENENDVFFHYSQLIMPDEGDYRTVEPGAVVEFEIGRNTRGPMATNIRKVK